MKIVELDELVLELDCELELNHSVQAHNLAQVPAHPVPVKAAPAQASRVRAHPNPVPVQVRPARRPAHPVHQLVHRPAPALRRVPVHLQRAHHLPALWDGRFILTIQTGNQLRIRGSLVSQMEHCGMLADGGILM